MSSKVNLGSFANIWIQNIIKLTHLNIDFPSNLEGYLPALRFKSESAFDFYFDKDDSF